MSGFGVPDDEMWDTLAPDEDLAPEEARDLEALLSGRAADPGSRPAAAAFLASLRAAPAPGELDGEAAALTAFRLFVLPERNWPAGQGEEAAFVPEALAQEALVPEAVAPEGVAAEAVAPEVLVPEALAPEAVAAQALGRLDPPSVPPVTDVPPPAPLPAPGSLTAPMNGSPVNPLAPASVARSPLTMTRPLTATRPLTLTSPPPGPRHRRPRGSWRGHGPAALVGAGSVAAGLVVLLCLLLIPGGGSAGREPGTGNGNGLASASGTEAKPQLQGTGTSEPSPSKSASRSPASRPGASTGPDSPAALCHQYVALFGHYGSPASRQTAMKILEQLGAHAGGQANVPAYCFSVINPGGANPWGAYPGSANPGPVNPGQWPPQPGEGQLPGGGQVDHGGFGPGFR